MRATTAQRGVELLATCCGVVRGTQRQRARMAEAVCASRGVDVGLFCRSFTRPDDLAHGLEGMLPGALFRRKTARTLQLHWCGSETFRHRTNALFMRRY